MKKSIYLLLSALLVISTLSGCIANMASFDNTPDAPATNQAKASSSLDLSQMDEQTFKQTITPYLDVYTGLISRRLFDPFIELSDDYYVGYSDDEENVIILGNDDVVPYGYESIGGTYDSGYLILNYSSKEALEEDYRNWASKYVDKDFINLDQRIENADPKLFQQDDELFLVYGAKGYISYGSNPESAVLLESNGGKYKVYAEFNYYGPGDTSREYFNLFLEIKDGKLLLVDAQKISMLTDFVYNSWDMQDMIEPHLKAYATTKSTFNYSQIAQSNDYSDFTVYTKDNGELIILTQYDEVPNGLNYKNVFFYGYQFYDYTSANELRKAYADWLSEWIDFDSPSFKHLYNDLNTDKDFSQPLDNLFEYDGKLYNVNYSAHYKFEDFSDYENVRVRYLEETAKIENILMQDDTDKFVISVKYETDNGKSGYTHFTFAVKQGKLIIVDAKEQ